MTNPEQRFKERHAHVLLTSHLQKQPGWTVTLSAYGLETAFVAVFDGRRARPVVSLNAEHGMLLRFQQQREVANHRVQIGYLLSDTPEDTI